MKAIRRHIRRAFLWAHMRAIETMIDGRNTCMELVTDPTTLRGMETIQTITRCELRRLRREYNALRRPARHQFWRVA